MIATIRELYAVEDMCPRGPPGDLGHLELLHELRQRHSKPIIEKIGRWCVEVEKEVLRRSRLGSVIDLDNGSRWRP